MCGAGPVRGPAGRTAGQGAGAEPSAVRTLVIGRRDGGSWLGGMRGRSLGRLVLDVGLTGGGGRTPAAADVAGWAPSPGGASGRADPATGSSAALGRGLTAPRGRGYGRPTFEHMFDHRSGFPPQQRPWFRSAEPPGTAAVHRRCERFERTGVAARPWCSRPARTSTPEAGRLTRRTGFPVRQPSGFCRRRPARPSIRRSP